MVSGMIRDGFSGVARDLGEFVTGGPIGWVLLGLLILLPVLSVALVVGGSRMAIIPLVIFLGIVVVWFLYHATHWWPNPGAAAGVLRMAAALLVAWLVLGVAGWRHLRRRSRASG